MARLTVNNQPVEYRLDPDTPLLWALRDASNLTGTKYGCGTGHCGGCTVDVDGEARRSCRVPIGHIEGSFVTTIEGLSRERNHPVQLAFLAENVVQCGFCIPGMVMAAAVLLKKNADPGEEAIRAALTNICR
jgi:isoquinoline 1-oxidoreductase alpha subunit